MKIGVLFSSGKDSTFTLHWCKEHDHEVACLLTLLPEVKDSYMYQTPSKEIVTAQAEALDLPVIFQQTGGIKEKELNELELLLKKAKEECGIEGVGVGALASNYQNDRVKIICDRLSLEVVAPLWKRDQLDYMRELIEQGYDIRLTKIAAMGLDKSWLGRELSLKDVERLGELRDELGLNPAGEGGEFESIVLNAPLFKKRIEISFKISMENKESGELVDIKVI